MYKLIRDEYPKLPLLYFSDSGEVPYGKLSKTRLRSRLEKVFEFLSKEGAEHIVVACHSASSVVLPTDKNVTGLRSQTVKAVTKRKPKSVGIIGGGRTIRSGYYRRELNKAGVKTSQRVAQELSILVERGEISGTSVDKAIAEILKPIASCDSILLACTHYPVLSDAIKKYTNATLIDPAEELYQSIRFRLDKKRTGPSVFLTTGDDKLMSKAAQLAFGVQINKPRKVTF